MYEVGCVETICRWLWRHLRDDEEAFSVVAKYGISIQASVMKNNVGCCIALFF
jgi:hypothetical protein